MARVNEWMTKDGLEQIKEWAMNGLTVVQIAANIGIARSTFYKWTDEYPELVEILKKGKEVADIQVENALYKSALGYEVEEVTRERIVDTGQKERHGGAGELTTKQWEFAKMYFGGKCCYCGTCGELTKDHVKPLNSGGEFIVSNIVPCCRGCNSSKNDNEMLSWYQRQTFYDKDKAQKIHDYIDLVINMETSFKEEDAELVVTKKVTKHVQPSTTAQIFWLKNRKPAEWRDRKDLEHSGRDGAPIEISNLTPEERKERIAELTKKLTETE